MRPKIASLLRVPARALAMLGRFLSRPIRWLSGRLGRGIAWLRPFLWEELGRLGIAARRVLSILAWPLLALLRPIGRLLSPLKTAVSRRITLRLLAFSRARRSQHMLRQARRWVRRQARLATTHNRPQSNGGLRRRWVHLVTGLATLNVILLYLVFRLSADQQSPSSAGPAVPPAVASQIPTSTPIHLPTATPPPSPIPITPAPTPDRLAVGGSVAFVKRSNGNDDIYAITVGQENPIRLTHNSADDRDPAWSPDGRQLAFASRRDGNWELYLLDLSTGRIGRLTHNVAYEANPTWSPDGQWLAYETYYENNLDIYILPVAGGDPIRLTSHPSPDVAPAWSPSGRHIAFVSWRSGNPDVWLFSLDDARDQAAVNISNSPEIWESAPSWHPGGAYLAYSGQNGSQQLVYAQPMLNNLPAGQPISIGQGHEPTWAPSGESVLYSHDENGQHYLLAGSVDGWGVAPEVYQDSEPLQAAQWQPASLPPLARAYYGQDAPLYLESVADPAETGAPYTLVALENLQVAGPYLNDRVDNSFQALRQRVLEEAGWDFLENLDKMWEPMDALPPPGLDTQSWNKAGRAFDTAREFSLGSLPLVEVRQELAGNGTATYWRVYIRAQRQDGSQGEPLTSLPWNFQARYSGNSGDYEAGGRLKSEIPAGYYVDFTQLAADCGWERVPAGRTWLTFYPAALFWHFEKTENLTWQEAMLELYTAKELDQVFEGFEP